MPKLLCTVDRCPNAQFAKGLCQSHYRRQHRAQKRGDKHVDLDSPVGLRNLTQLGGPRVPEVVATRFRAMAKAQGKTEYEALRDLVFDWYERAFPGEKANPNVLY